MRDASSPVVDDRLSRCCQIWQMKIIGQIVFSEFFVTQCLYEIAFSLPSLLAFSFFSLFQHFWGEESYQFGVGVPFQWVREVVGIPLIVTNASQWKSVTWSFSSKSKNKIKYHHYFFVYSFNFSILKSRQGYFSLASFCSLKKRRSYFCSLMTFSCNTFGKKRKGPIVTV